MSAFEMGIHACSSLHYKLVTGFLASAVLEETVTRNSLSSAWCRYGSLISQSAHKKFCGHIKESADKTQQEHENADPTGE